MEYSYGKYLKLVEEGKIEEISHLTRLPAQLPPVP